MDKPTLIKGIRLEKYFKSYRENEGQRKQIIAKFTDVWGSSMADHFLSKYDDAESLIWAFDSKNLTLFIQKF